MKCQYLGASRLRRSYSFLEVSRKNEKNGCFFIKKMRWDEDKNQRSNQWKNKGKLRMEIKYNEIKKIIEIPFYKEDILSVKDIEIVENLPEYLRNYIVSIFLK